MRRLFTVLLLLGSLAAAFAPRQSEAAATATNAASGRIIKVLPMLLDHAGRDALTPSLFERDAYQAFLRQHTNNIAAIRVDVLWKASHAGSEPLKLRAELRGVGDGGMPRQMTLETNVTPKFFRSWTPLKLGGKNLKYFGELVSWRVTLWDGDRMIGEQKSFLW